MLNQIDSICFTICARRTGVGFSYVDANIPAHQHTNVTYLHIQSYLFYVWHTGMIHSCCNRRVPLRGVAGRCCEVLQSPGAAGRLMAHAQIANGKSAAKLTCRLCRVRVARTTTTTTTRNLRTTTAANDNNNNNKHASKQVKTTSRQHE